LKPFSHSSKPFLYLLHSLGRANEADVVRILRINHHAQHAIVRPAFFLGLGIEGTFLEFVRALDVQVRSFLVGNLDIGHLGHVVDALAVRRNEEGFPAIDIILGRAADALEDDDFCIELVVPSMGKRN